MDLESINISFDTVFGTFVAEINFSSSDEDELENFKNQCLSEED